MKRRIEHHLAIGNSQILEDGNSNEKDSHGGIGEDITTRPSRMNVRIRIGVQEATRSMRPRSTNTFASADEAATQLVNSCSLQPLFPPMYSDTELQLWETIQDPQSDPTFATAADTTETDINVLQFVYKRVVKFWKSSAECNDPARPVHEAEWNDELHVLMLDLAFECDGSIAFHILVNVASGSALVPKFKDTNLFLKENMVDYGVFSPPGI
ncbi:hypothetical protein F5Y13DRAFT_200930 [Hypoxylon sp. FL1857]|nr:hypothetical protein F5Y13DRAFT_200930 [Hypoxylon sp. FL1857]